MFVYFVSWKTNFPKVFCLKLCFINFFTFEFNIFNDKIPKTKYSHLSNGLQLTSQVVHFFVSWRTKFPKMFSLKILIVHFFLFKFNIFSNKIPERKHSRLRNGLQLISKNAHFPSVEFCLIKFLFPFQKFCKIVFVQLISNQNDLFFNCTSLNTVKISFVKIKLFRFNLHTILFHT